VVRGPLRVTVDKDGKTRIKERYVVSAPLAGRLQRISLRPGDRVTAGTTVLAVLEPCDPALLDDRARTEVEARVRAAEASRKQAGTKLERARGERPAAVAGKGR
jgi:HlyD family secretion protein